MSLHSFDSHCAALAKLCRVCGDKNLTEKGLKQNRKPKSCKELISDLILVFGIDIKYDIIGTHSQHVCHKCIMTISNVKRRQSTVSINNAS